MGSLLFVMLRSTGLIRICSAASRRQFAAAAEGDAIKDLFASEFKNLSERLKAARDVEKEVPADVMAAMTEEANAAKARTGLSGIGQVDLSKKLKIGDL